MVSAACLAAPIASSTWALDATAISP